jgi:hypothetical protein
MHSENGTSAPKSESYIEEVKSSRGKSGYVRPMGSMQRNHPAETKRSGGQGVKTFNDQSNGTVSKGLYPLAIPPKDLERVLLRIPFRRTTTHFGMDY